MALNISTPFGMSKNIREDSDTLTYILPENRTLLMFESGPTNLRMYVPITIPEGYNQVKIDVEKAVCSFCGASQSSNNSLTWSIKTNLELNNISAVRHGDQIILSHYWTKQLFAFGFVVLNTKIRLTLSK